MRFAQMDRRGRLERAAAPIASDMPLRAQKTQAPMFHSGERCDCRRPKFAAHASVLPPFRSDVDVSETISKPQRENRALFAVRSAQRVGHSAALDSST